MYTSGLSRLEGLGAGRRPRLDGCPGVCVVWLSVGRRFEPQHLANSVWAAASAGAAPSDDWLEEWLTAAFVALRRRAFSPQQLANSLWALERLGVMPEQASGVARASAHTQPPASIANRAWVVR
jgi:hypothetical protein